MIDPLHPFASWFLWIGGAFFLGAYALPLLIVPLHWARWFRWSIPIDDHLSIYLGRCLGGVAVALVWVCFRAAPQPPAHPLAWELLIIASALLTGVHLWGALRRIQPWTETVEIAMYAGLTAMAAWLYAGF